MPHLLQILRQTDLADMDTEACLVLGRSASWDRAALLLVQGSPPVLQEKLDKASAAAVEADTRIRQLQIFLTNLNDSTKGACTYDVCKIFGIFAPPPLVCIL